MLAKADNATIVVRLFGGGRFWPMRHEPQKTDGAVHVPARAEERPDVVAFGVTASGVHVTHRAPQQGTAPTA
jgi:hypothetical protein